MNKKDVAQKQNDESSGLKKAHRKQQKGADDDDDDEVGRLVFIFFSFITKCERWRGKMLFGGCEIGRY